MMCPQESFDPLDIATIEQATAELNRLYETFNERASDYHLVQPRQPQGFNEDWHRNQAKGTFEPKLNPVQRRHGRIELGAYQGAFSGIEAKYDMRVTKAGELIVQRYGIMLDPGDRYKSDGSQLWRAARTPFYTRMAMNHEPGFDAWTSHLWLTDAYTKLIQVDDDVRATILDLRGYEPAQAE